MSKTIFTLLSVLALAAAIPAWASDHGESSDDDAKTEGMEKEEIDCPHMKRMHHGGGGEWFDEVDTNQDGELSFEEFKANHDEMLKKKFAEMDGDGSGQVSREEMRAMKAEMREKMQEKREEMQEKKGKKGKKGDKNKGDDQDD